MKTLKHYLTALLFLGLFPVAMAAESDIQNHPGYVDFARLTAIAGTEPTVEISLKSPLLSMITNLIRHEDEEAADFISKLERVTVNVFESSDVDVDELSSSMNDVAKELDGEGWDRVVRIREDSDHVDIYFRLSDDADVILGIAIMIAAPGDTVLVNIVGNISTDDLSALGRRFDIDELIDIDMQAQEEPGDSC